MLIALIGFSCRRGDLDTVLIHDRAWRNHEWRGHHRPNGHGRKFNNEVCASGICANILQGARQEVYLRRST
jgi:hypothetical protein